MAYGKNGSSETRDVCAQKDMAAIALEVAVVTDGKWGVCAEWGRMGEE